MLETPLKPKRSCRICKEERLPSEFFWKYKGVCRSCVSRRDKMQDKEWDKLFRQTARRSLKLLDQPSNKEIFLDIINEGLVCTLGDFSQTSALYHSARTYLIKLTEAGKLVEINKTYILRAEKITIDDLPYYGFRRKNDE